MKIIDILKLIYRYDYDIFNCIKILGIYNEFPLKIAGYYNIHSNTIDKLLNKEIKESNFIIYDECGHSGDWYLIGFETIEEVEKYILSNSTFFNMFTSVLTVIEKGKIKEYKIYDKNNEELKIGSDLECDLKDINIIWEK